MHLFEKALRPNTGYKSSSISFWNYTPYILSGLHSWAYCEAINQSLLIDNGVLIELLPFFDDTRYSKVASYFENSIIKVTKDAAPVCRYSAAINVWEYNLGIDYGQNVGCIINILIKLCIY